MRIFLVAVSIFLISISAANADETLTITTYYPSPYGSYKELSAYRMKIGDTYATTSWTDTDNDKLIVEGSVGIGTDTPGNYKLYVQGGNAYFSGNVTVDGNVAVAGAVTANDFTGDGIVPVDAVMFFNSSSCPTGWFEYMAARGRVIVGRPWLGDLEGTVGTALTNIGTRTITKVVSHSHPFEGNTTSNGVHSHTMDVDNDTSGNTANANTGDQDATVISTNSAGSHTHAYGGTTLSAGDSSVDVTMPYVQLLACQKDK